MKTNYEGFRGWLNYIRDYKDNKDNDLICANEMIKATKKMTKLEKQIEQLSYIGREKDNLIELKDKRIEAIGNKISSYAKRNDELRSVIETLSKENDVINEQLKIKELARRKTAGQVGGLKAKISVLKKDLARANQKINWLSNNQKAPTKEEIIAYELQMKEVEKKLKKDIE